MSDVTKFVADDHNRIRRAFSDFHRRPTLDVALNVCDTIWIHQMIDAELIQAAIWDELTPEEAEEVGRPDEEINRVMELVDGMEPKDPALDRTMVLLERAVEAHNAAYSSCVRPKLAGRADELELGRAAFRRWQQLFEERPPRAWVPMNRLANTGWGGGGKLANTGW